MTAAPFRLAPQSYDDAIPVAVMREHPANANDGDTGAIDESLAAHGFYGAVGVQRSTGYLLWGNHRYRQAVAAGAAELPGFWLDVDDEQAAKILAVDNRSNRLGRDDAARAVALLRPMSDLTGTAYKAADLAALVARSRPSADRDDQDDAPPKPAKPVTAKGDLYQLGAHRLLCGDATRAEHVARLFGDAGPPALLCTDPPYCSGGYQEGGRGAGSVGTTAKGTHKQIANDRLSTRGYLALMRAVIGNSDARYAYVFTDWRMWNNLFDVVESNGFGVRNMIVWDKESPGAGRGWRSQHEIIMWATKEAQPNSGKGLTSGNVLHARRTGNLLHTTQKPEDILAQLLRVAHYARSLYDPMAGSGTALIAAEDHDWPASLMELDPAYCDVICGRWQRYTGRVPLLLASDGSTQPRDFTGEG